MLGEEVAKAAMAPAEARDVQGLADTACAADEVGDAGQNALVRSQWHARVLAVLAAQCAAEAAAVAAGVAGVESGATLSLQAYAAARGRPDSAMDPPDVTLDDFTRLRAVLAEGGEVERRAGPACAHAHCPEPGVVLVVLALVFEDPGRRTGVTLWGQDAVEEMTQRQPMGRCCGWVHSSCTGCGAAAEDVTQRVFYAWGKWHSLWEHLGASPLPDAAAFLCVGCAREAASEAEGAAYPGASGRPLAAHRHLYHTYNGELSSWSCDHRGEGLQAVKQAVVAVAEARDAARGAAEAAAAAALAAVGSLPRARAAAAVAAAKALAAAVAAASAAAGAMYTAEVAAVEEAIAEKGLPWPSPAHM